MKNRQFDLNTGVRFITKSSSTGWIHDDGYSISTKQRALSAMRIPLIVRLGLKNPGNEKRLNWILRANGSHDGKTC